MKQFYQNRFYIPSLIIAITLLSTNAVFGNSATHPGDTTEIQKNTKTKISDTRKDKPAFLKKELKVNLVPFKPSLIKMNSTPVSVNSKGAKNDDRILSKVKVYPNPVADQLNVYYHVSRDVNMTIKIMDFLGNEVATLLSGRVSSGEQNNSFSISAKLNSGLYFVRFIAGSETVVKRISVR